MIHLYADDTQLYFTFDSNDPQGQEQRIIKCMHDIRVWMLQNFLKLNESKTDMIISPKYDVMENPATLQLTADGTVSEVQQTLMSLGVHLDEKLSMSSHAESMVSDIKVNFTA